MLCRVSGVAGIQPGTGDVDPVPSLTEVVAMAPGKGAGVVSRSSSIHQAAALHRSLWEALVDGHCCWMDGELLDI